MTFLHYTHSLFSEISIAFVCNVIWYKQSSYLWDTEHTKKCCVYNTVAVEYFCLDDEWSIYLFIFLQSYDRNRYFIIAHSIHSFILVMYACICWYTCSSFSPIIRHYTNLWKMVLLNINGVLSMYNC